MPACSPSSCVPAYQPSLLTKPTLPAALLACRRPIFLHSLGMLCALQFDLWLHLNTLANRMLLPRVLKLQNSHHL